MQVPTRRDSILLVQFCTELGNRKRPFRHPVTATRPSSLDPEPKLAAPTPKLKFEPLEFRFELFHRSCKIYMRQKCLQSFLINNYMKDYNQSKHEY